MILGLLEAFILQMFFIVFSKGFRRPIPILNPLVDLCTICDFQDFQIGTFRAPFPRKSLSKIMREIYGRHPWTDLGAAWRRKRPRHYPIINCYRSSMAFGASLDGVFMIWDDYAIICRLNWGSDLSSNYHCIRFTSPRSILLKPWPGGMRVSDPPPLPEEGRSVQDFPLEALKLQISNLRKPVRSLASPSIFSSPAAPRIPRGRHKNKPFLDLPPTILIWGDVWLTFCLYDPTWGVSLSPSFFE